MTCHLCAEAVGIALDGDRLLCLDCWRTRHIVRPEDKPAPRDPVDHSTRVVAYLDRVRPAKEAT